MSIGKGQAYAKRRQFEERVRELAQETLIPFRQRIIDMDIQTSNQPPTVDGGFDAIVERYRACLSSQNRN
jgi:hypothetical protein